MGFGIKKEAGSNTTPSQIVNFDQITPTTPGVIFDPDTPETLDVLYVSSVNASTWIWNGTAYVTYSAPSLPSTEWYLLGTTIDAGSNKTARISRNNSIYTINSDSYFNLVRIGRGGGSISTNTVVGMGSGTLNTTGTSNAFFGNGSGTSNTTGVVNTFIGTGSGYFNTIGSYNSFLGGNSGGKNTTGSNNTFNGYNSGYNNTTGGNNTFVGDSAGYSNTTAINNTFVGSNALQYCTTGGANIGLGSNAGKFVSTGENNVLTYESIFIGHNTKPLANDQTNQIVIGYNTIGKGSNTVNIGNTSVTDSYINGTVHISNTWVLPTTAPTSGQVLGYLGAGTTAWVTSGGGSGVCGIANSSGVYTYYATLSLAITAATSGQTVDLLTDITETGSVTLTMKAGVKINGNGYTYTLSVNDDTSAITSGSTLIELFNIKVVRTGRAINLGGRVFWKNDTGTLATLRCQNVVFENTYGIAVAANNAIIDGVRIISYGTGVYAPFDSTGVYNCIITSSNAYGIDLGNSSYDIINCNVIGSTYGIYCGYGTVYNSIGRTTTGNGIAATRVVNSTGTASSGNGVVTNNGNNCVGISTSGVGLSGGFKNSTGISTSGFAGGGTFYNCSLISSSNYALSTTSTVTMYNSYAESTSSPVTARANIYNSTVRCLWNNAGGSCTNSFVVGSHEVMNSFLEVTNASAYCITGYVGSTWKFAGNIYKGATTAVNTTNITQTITNTSDNQGNILM
jgi:hypothetical protein